MSLSTGQRPDGIKSLNFHEKGYDKYNLEFSVPITELVKNDKK